MTRKFPDPQTIWHEKKNALDSIGLSLNSKEIRLNEESGLWVKKTFSQCINNQVMNLWGPSPRESQIVSPPDPWFQSTHDFCFASSEERQSHKARVPPNRAQMRMSWYDHGRDEFLDSDGFLPAQFSAWIYDKATKRENGWDCREVNYSRKRAKIIGAQDNAKPRNSTITCTAGDVDDEAHL